MSEEFDQRARELDVLAESSRLLTSTLDPGEVLDRLAEIAQARIGADIARIWLLDDAGESLELRAQTGVIRGTVGLKQRLSPHDSVAGWVIAHKEPLCIADVQADTRLVNARVVRGRGGGLAPRRADHARRPADRDPRVSVAHPAGVHAGRCGAGAGADRAGGGGGAQCRALRRRRGTARGDRGVPARGVGDLGLPELETALRAVVRELHGLLHSDAALCTPWTRRRAGCAC